MGECYFCGEKRKEDWYPSEDEPCECGSWDWVYVGSREADYTYGDDVLEFNNIDNILEDKRNGTYRHSYK